MFSSSMVVMPLMPPLRRQSRWTSINLRPAWFLYISFRTAKVVYNHDPVQIKNLLFFRKIEYLLNTAEHTTMYKKVNVILCLNTKRVMDSNKERRKNLYLKKRGGVILG